MLFPELSLAIEAIGAVLLAVVIFYAVRLNRLLATLKADKAELESLVATFSQSTSRAEANVARLKSNAAETAQALQGSVGKAEALRDELAFMIERANDHADRLEAAIGKARPAQGGRIGPGAPGGADVKAGPGQAAEGKARKSKSDLLKALEGMR